MQGLLLPKTSLVYLEAMAWSFILNSVTQNGSYINIGADAALRLKLAKEKLLTIL